MPSDVYAVCVHVWHLSKREIFIKLFYNYGLTSYDILLNIFILGLKQGFPSEQVGYELMVLLPQPPACWNCRPEPRCPELLWTVILPILAWEEHDRPSTHLHYDGLASLTEGAGLGTTLCKGSGKTNSLTSSAYWPLSFCCSCVMQRGRFCQQTEPHRWQQLHKILSPSNITAILC